MDIPRPEHARRRRRRRIIVGCLVLFGFALATLALTRLTIPPVLLGAAVAACWLPARRAARVDPLVALRSE